MPVQVQGPDGNTYQFPDGTDKSAAVAYFKKKGIGIKTESATSTDPSGRTPTGEPAPGDERNGVQRWLDNLTTPDPRREEWQSPARNTADDFVRHIGSAFLPLISHPVDSVAGIAKSAGQASVDNPGNAAGAMSQFLVNPLIEQYVTESAEKGNARAALNLAGTGAGMWATGEASGALSEAAKPVVGKVTRGLLEKAAKAREGVTGKLSAKYGPRQVEVGGEKIPVLVGEADPESGAGHTQTSLKRSGLAQKRFEKVENAQQSAVKDVIRNTAQKTSGAIGPMQVEPSDVVNDAATASYAQAAPLYEELDASLVKVPDALQKVSRITQDAINKAQKLRVDVGEGVDLTKITPEKDGTIQWGGTRISKATHPEVWSKLVNDGIIDESGVATPLKAYRQVRSQLLKMQRASSDAGVRYAIGKDIDTMTNNIETALKGTDVEKNWSEANRLWSKGKALQDVSEAVRDATKGTPASAQAPGVSPVPTKLQGASLVSKLNDLYQDGTLERAFTHEEVSNLRQAADILDRIQRNPVGRGAGESASMSRGLTHALRGNAGPLIGAGVGVILDGVRGAEMGAGLGFIIQKIGEQGLVRVMTKLEGVKALKSLEEAKTPAQTTKAMTAIIGAAAATPRGPKSQELQKIADEHRKNSSQQ